MVRTAKRGGSEEMASVTRDLAGAPAAWGLARRTDHEDPCPRRRQRTAHSAEADAGQAHDGRSADDMLAGLGEGQILLADRGYDSDALRARLARQGAGANIKPMPNRVGVPSFSAYLYPSVISSNASSTNLSISARWRRATKSTTPTTSPSPNSPPSEYGSGL